MKTKLFLLSILIAFIACSKKDDTSTPQQTNNNNNQATQADTVSVGVVCQGCITIPSICNVTLSGVINQPLAQWYSGYAKNYFNVPFGTIYYSASHNSSVNGQFEVTATQKHFTIAVPD